MATKTMEKPAPRADNKPDFVVRARQGKNSRFFQSVGFAWRKHDRNGQEIISVKLNAMPIESDGSFLLVPPFTDDSDGTME